jgi:hypothetical protein
MTEHELWLRVEELSSDLEEAREVIRESEMAYAALSGRCDAYASALEAAVDMVSDADYERLCAEQPAAREFARC